jgi:hypothetical protein
MKPRLPMARPPSGPLARAPERDRERGLWAFRQASTMPKGRRQQQSTEEVAIAKQLHETG